MFDPNGIEAERLIAQRRLDLARSQTERNLRGQFATPAALADDMLCYAREHFGTGAVRFLDPAIGTGSFYSALLRTWSGSNITRATGFELDPDYGRASRALWSGSRLRLRIEDFTAASAPRSEARRYNLIICNPPYVRHHHMTSANKQRLHRQARTASGSTLSGLAGLHAYFLMLTHPWMSSGALAGWLIPSEFREVNYGDAIRDYLLRRVTLLRVHCFEPSDLQFNDALVSSAIVWFRNRPPSVDHTVELTCDGPLSRPRACRQVSARELSEVRKWRSRATTAVNDPVLGEFFKIQRGLATGANRFFIMTAAEARERGIPAAYLRPILPGPKQLAADEILADERGYPRLPCRLVIVDCPLPLAQVRARHPAFWRYLQSGLGGVSAGYLCSRRSPWYSQESRQSTAFLCSYFARWRGERLHRFIFNHSRAIAANNYLMLYPRGELLQFIGGNLTRARAVWRELCNLKAESLRYAGRSYGGGMYKLEPKELASVPAAPIGALLRTGSSGLD
ncbi:MAG TPA: hypothetical protein VNZ06_07380 [Steroidobacteraceae bacterium]|jgi:adenine-specific DNA-methyltransferase|nr:hypothetical protein [Steroidobacteraceae bacterium]